MDIGTGGSRKRRGLWRGVGTWQLEASVAPEGPGKAATKAAGQGRALATEASVAPEGRGKAATKAAGQGRALATEASVAPEGRGKAATKAAGQGAGQGCGNGGVCSAGGAWRGRHEGGRAVAVQVAGQGIITLLPAFYHLEKLCRLALHLARPTLLPGFYHAEKGGYSSLTPVCSCKAPFR